MKLRTMAAVVIGSLATVLIAPAAVAADSSSYEQQFVKQFLSSSDYGRGYSSTVLGTWYSSIADNWDSIPNDYADKAGLFDLDDPSYSEYAECRQSAGYKKLAELKCPGMWISVGNGKSSWIDGRSMLKSFANSWADGELSRPQLSQPYETVTRGDTTTAQKTRSVAQSQTYQPKPLADYGKEVELYTGGKVKAKTVENAVRSGGMWGSAKQKLTTVTKSVNKGLSSAVDLFFVPVLASKVTGGLLNFEFIGDQSLGDDEYFCSTVGDGWLSGVMTYMADKTEACAELENALSAAARNSDITSLYSLLAAIDTPVGGTQMTDVSLRQSEYFTVMDVTHEWSGRWCASDYNDKSDCWYGYPVVVDSEGNIPAATATSGEFWNTTDSSFLSGKTSSPVVSVLASIWDKKASDNVDANMAKLGSVTPAYLFKYYYQDGKKHCFDGSVTSTNCGDEIITSQASDQDPERQWETCVTYQDGTEACSTDPTAFRESSDSVATPQGQTTVYDGSHGAPVSVKLNEINTDTGTRTPVMENEADDDYKDFLTKFAGCYDGSCVLDLVDKAKDTSCYALGDACTAWYESTSKETDYECRYGGINIGLESCTALKTAFKAATQLSGQTVTDPETGEQLGQVEPSDEQTEPAEACWSEPWSDSTDPISYVFKPVKCALVWAFEPTSEQSAKLTDGVAALAATVPAVAAVRTMFDGLSTSVDMSGCSGMNIDLHSVNNAFPELPSFLASCEGDSLYGARVAVNTLLKALLLWATATGVARHVGGIIGYDSKPGGDGQMEVRA